MVSSKVVALVLVALTGAARAQGDPVRLLGPSDVVPGFGRIGTGGVEVRGIDDRGRVLLLRYDVPFTQYPSLYWGAGASIAPAIDLSDLTDAKAVGWDSGWSPQGNLAVAVYQAARSPGSSSDLVPAVYAVVNGQRRRVAAYGDQDADGNTLCGMKEPRINDAGQVALLADIVAAGLPCAAQASDGSSLQHQAIYVADSSLHRVLEAGVPFEPPLIELVALAPDGSAIVIQSQAGQTDVLAVSLSGMRVLVSGPIDVADANHVGDVLYVSDDGAFFRTDGGTSRRVVGLGDPSPWGDTYQGSDFDPANHVLSDRGDVLLRERGHLVLHPAAGGPALVFPSVDQFGALNGVGDVALTEEATDTGALSVVRVHGTDSTRITGTGDVLPDGTFVVSGGLAQRCMATDGSVAVVGTAANGANGFLCGDAAGFHTVTRRGDPAPGGRRFYSFGPCVFDRPGELVFSADTLVPDAENSTATVTYDDRDAAIYRARPDALERLIGPGDVTTDGEIVRSFPGGTDNLFFDTDPSGDVLAMVTFTDCRAAALVVRRASGALERVPLTPLGVGCDFPEEIPADDPLTDYLFLAGLSPVPTLSQAGTVHGASALDHRAAIVGETGVADPYAVVTGARLTATGAVVILADEEVPPGFESQNRILRWENGSLEQIFAEGALAESTTPDLYDLHIASERFGFIIGSADRSNAAIYSYGPGDDAPVERVRANDPALRGPNGFPYQLLFLGIGDDGRLFFATPEFNEGNLFVWDNGTISRITHLGAGESATVNPQGAVLLTDFDTGVSVIGPTPSGACPMPPPGGTDCDRDSHAGGNSDPHSHR